MSNTYSLKLDTGESDFVQIADASQTGLDITGNFTASFWIKLQSNPGASAIYGLFNKRGASGNRGYSVYYQENGGNFDMIIEISSDGTAETSKTWSSVNLGTAAWKHVAIVYTAAAGTADLYIDTVSFGQVTALPTAIFNNNAAFIIGSRSAAQFANVLIDEFQMYNSVKTPSSIWKNNVYGESGLQAYWSLNNVYTDPANSNTLTTSGSPSFSATVPFTNYANEDSGFLAIL